MSKLGGIRLCLSRHAKSFTFRARLGLHEIRRANDRVSGFGTMTAGLG
jgi:hypothetical protein